LSSQDVNATARQTPVEIEAKTAVGELVTDRSDPKKRK
jgi:hypothetical protein